MSYRLKTYVTAVEQGGEGRTGTFGPDSDLSAPENAWALAAINNPDVWDGEVPPLREPDPIPVPGAGSDAGQADAEVERLRARISELERQLADRDAQIAELVKPAEPDDPTPPDPEIPVPPRGGPGSAAPAWRAYATAVGVEVDPDASRDDVIAALEKAGKPTE